MHTLILASESPRRKKLLKDAGFSFHVFSVKVSEILEKNLTEKLTVDEQIIEIAMRKALAALETYKPLKKQDFLILAADTMVVFENQPIGKPATPDEAKKTLGLLSGKKHQVKTGIVIIEGHFDGNTNFKKKIVSEISTTEVHFRPILRHEIDAYVLSGEPLDKAGSYGIQGLGGAFVEKIDGAFDNVVGLPITVFRKIILQNNWEINE